LLDIKLIRENPEMVRANLERRQQPEKLELLQQVTDADKRWRELTAQVNGPYPTVKTTRITSS
jgi:seryl-tRNA synthetase